MATIKRLEELTKIDIIELLNISTDKKDALNRYLNDAQENLLKGDSISAYMKQEMNILKEDMQSCLTEKQISDKEYFDAIDRYDQNIMETSLNSSIMHENCVTEKRIQYNAKASIIQKLVFYLGLLQQKYDILFAKQDILTQNFEIFRDKILPDLNQIDELLKQYTF
jgi:phage shock protein A